MLRQTLLLTSVLAALYGCQPEAPKQAAQPAAPAPAEQPAAPPASTTPAPAAAAPSEPAAAAPAMPAPAAPAADVAAKPAPSQDEAMQLAKKSGCLTCHAIDKKGVGPKWKDVAAKYRGDAGAEAKLDEKILKGGSGVWGSIPMPAHPKLSEADRKTLVKFVLSLE